MVSGAGNASQLSMRAVAVEVGVAATSVYLHFTDIDELKVAVADRGFAELARVRDAALAEIDDPAEALVARCLTYAQFGLAHPGQYRLMFGSELSASVFTQAYDAENSAIRRAYDALTDAIRRCQQSGAAPDDADPVLLAVLLWPALHGQVSMRIDRPHFPRPPLDEVITQTVQRLVGLELAVPRDRRGSSPL
ncbi:MAG: TetR-like C-terminal domain-containing protein [Solirubrobacteraceae bacterium]